MRKRRWYWWLGLAVCLNMGIATLVDRFKNPHLTETELFIRIPQTFIWNFK